MPNPYQAAASNDQFVRTLQRLMPNNPSGAPVHVQRPKRPRSVPRGSTWNWHKKWWQFKFEDGSVGRWGRNGRQLVPSYMNPIQGNAHQDQWV